MTNDITTIQSVSDAFRSMPSSQLYALVFLVIGFLLSEVSKLCWSLFVHTRRKSRVRRILCFEVDHNLSVLREFWDAVLAVEPPNAPAEFITRCNQIIKRPFPAFHDHAFLSESSNIASYLSQRKIEGLLNFHSKLSALRELRGMMQARVDEEHENWRLASKGTNKLHFEGKDQHWDLPDSPFSDQAEQLFGQAKEIVDPLLAAGNMLE